MSKSQNQPECHEKVIASKVGTTTYVISSSFNNNSKEDMTKKISRLIMTKAKNIL